MEGKEMKITKRQLRRIIKEEKSKLVEIGFGSMEPFAPDYDTRDPLDDFDPIQLSYTNPQTGEAVSKPLYSSGEADDAFDLMFSIDPNIKYSVDDIREGKRNIKTTRQQLRRIIKEAQSLEGYSQEAIDAAKYAVGVVPYPQGGLIENEIHLYLENTVGLDRRSDEIFAIADEALSVAGIMLGVGPDAL
jgi:hypothetical protein